MMSADLLNTDRVKCNKCLREEACMDLKDEPHGAHGVLKCQGCDSVLAGYDSMNYLALDEENAVILKQ
jgi:hypothetical protein